MLPPCTESQARRVPNLIPPRCFAAHLETSASRRIRMLFTTPQTTMQNLGRYISEPPRCPAYAVPLALGAAVVDSALYDVPGGFRAVMFDRFTGVKPTSTGEGTHLLIPGLQRAILYDCRIKPRVSARLSPQLARLAFQLCPAGKAFACFAQRASCACLPPRLAACLAAC